METAVVGTDDREMMETLGAEAEALGYAPIYAANGLEIAQETRRKCPGLVFIDASILVISACACCQELRQDPSLPGTLPIFLLSDNARNPAMLERCGFTGLLPKRHNFQDLREFLACKVWI